MNILKNVLIRLFYTFLFTISEKSNLVTKQIFLISREYFHLAMKLFLATILARITKFRDKTVRRN